MNNYLAKSKPRETIQEHTDQLLKNFYLLKNLYPNLNINWELLKVATKYHDLGKMNLKFQSKVEGKKRYSDEIAHNLLSLAFLDKNELKKHFSKDEIEVLAQAIAYHHERGDYNAENYGDEIEALKLEAVNFKYDEVIISNIKKISARYFSDNRIYENEDKFYEYVKVKGILNRLDYAASAHIEVEVENNFLCEGLNSLHYQWNELQKFMQKNKDNNVVVVAQTGIGKTEAGLLWIGDNKGFFTLPLKTAINEIYKRITKNIAGIQNKHLVGLLHSDTYSKYIENRTEDEDVDEYYNKTKQLSLPITVCTLDQLFDVVFRFRGFESKLATLSYSKVVIDEVQMYSADLLAYLILGLSYITKIGGKFAVLTATLPGIVTDLLKEQNVEFVEPAPFINNELIRHSLKIVKCPINSAMIAEKFSNNKILVICNTVKEAQRIYTELNNDEVLKKKCENINLFHGKFIKKHRKEKEEAIVEFGQIECCDCGIWIATQVVEASLDIDFDMLFTELSDVNGLFQRMGRCYRKRIFGMDGYNCYVFDGGDKTCSGVGKFIDVKVFEFSKQALQIIDGKITELQKLEIIAGVYNTEKLKDTEFYNNVTDNIKYVQSLKEYELNKRDVRKKFRNIDSVTIIPHCVYIENQREVDSLVVKILKEDNKIVKTQTLNKLNEFTINVNRYEIAQKQPRIINISKYQDILIYGGFEYDNEIGLRTLYK